MSLERRIQELESQMKLLRTRAPVAQFTIGTGQGDATRLAFAGTSQAPGLLPAIVLDPDNSSDKDIRFKLTLNGSTFHTVRSGQDGGDIILNYSPAAASGWGFTVNNTGWTDAGDEGAGILIPGTMSFEAYTQHLFAVFASISTGTGSLRLQNTEGGGTTLATTTGIGGAAALDETAPVSNLPATTARLRLEGRGTAASATMTLVGVTWLATY